MPSGRTRLHFLLLALLMAASIGLVYLPFLLQAHEFLGVPLPETGLSVVQRYWDGPLYTVVSATFYAASPLYAFGPLSRSYYAAHLAFYPLTIRLLSVLAAPMDAMLLSTLLFSILSVLMFYVLVRDFKYSKHPFWLSCVFIFFPVRWLIYHSVGATEPPFIFLSLASFYFFKKARPWLAAVFASLASVTRIIGILLFAFYALYFLWKRRDDLLTQKFLPYLLIPATLGLYFLFYNIVLGDFFAYFKVNLFVLTPLPFQSVVHFGGAIPGEYEMLLYLLYFLGIARLMQLKHHDLALWSLLLAAPVAFFSWNDIARYLLPAFPFALLIAYEEFWTNKWALPVFAVLLYGFYLHVWMTIPTNLMPADQFVRLLGML